MKLTGIVGADELRECYESLRTQWTDGAEELERNVGYQGGGALVPIWWRPIEHMWAVFDESADVGRYWCGYGTEDAAQVGNLVPVVEINLPTDGANPQLGGVIATDVLGYKMLLHTGQVAGGRRGVGKTAFVASLSDREQCLVDWDGAKQTKAYLIGRLGDSRLVQKIASYVRVVEEFKRGVAQNVDRG